MAAVSVNDGTNVLAGGVTLKSDSPWISVLRPGMWFEAYGRWDGNTFVADSVRTLPGATWAYYRGPGTLLGQTDAGTIEAWTDADTRLEAVQPAAAPSEEVRVVAYYDGAALLALPDNLQPPTLTVSPGWLELTGTFDGERVVWTMVQTLP